MFGVCRNFRVWIGVADALAIDTAVTIIAYFFSAYLPKRAGEFAQLVSAIGPSF